jgi:hypothetical protein
MATDFDPEKYLAQKKSSEPVSFDPGAYLEKSRLRDSAFQMPVRRQEPVSYTHLTLPTID